MDASGSRAQPVGVFVGHTEGVTHIDSKGDGRYLISNAKDQTVGFWTQLGLRVPRSDTAYIHIACPACRSRCVQIRLWDVRAARSPREAARLSRKGVPSFSW